MGPLTLLNHAINFVAPAAWLALLVPTLSRFVIKKGPVAYAFIKQIAINFVFCLATLVLGLLFFGRDGKMLTYLALVLASATCQWVLLKGWRA